MRPLRRGARMTAERQAHREKYAAHLASPRWWAIRRAWWVTWRERHGDAPYLCPGGCGKELSVDDDAHHRSYDRLGHEDERWSDLVFLDRDCHRQLHAALDNSRHWRKMPRHIATDRILAGMRAERERQTPDA